MGICTFRAKERTFSHHLGCCWTSGSFHRDTAAYALLSSKKAQESSWRSAWWGPSTPRPPLLIVQPKGGLPSWEVVSRIHGARVPGAEQFARRPGPGQGRAGARGAQGRGRAMGWMCRPAGQPREGAGGAAPPLRARPRYFGTSRRWRPGCGREGERTGYAEDVIVGWSPFPGACARRGDGGVPAGPGLLA